MSTGTQTFDNFISIVESIHSESKPTIKLRYLTEANTLSTLMFSIYYHNLIYKCPMPIWNDKIATTDDTLTVVGDIIVNGLYDTKSYYALPFKTQKVIYYASKSSNLGLQASHILSGVNVWSIAELLTYLGIGSVNTVVEHECPRCSEAIPDGMICNTCIQKLLNTVQFRVGDFDLYGVAHKDFKVKLPVYDLVVTNGHYEFFYRDKALVEPYQGSLPFEEYQNNIEVVL